MRFALLIEMLCAVFESGSNEEEYHTIVNCMHDYNTCRDEPITEKDVLVGKGWPTNYHPCDHMENIRWGICFMDQPNPLVEELIVKYMDVKRTT